MDANNDENVYDRFDRNEKLDDLLDFSIIGAAHQARGLTDYRRWSQAMLAEGFAEIRPFLPSLFDNSKRMLQRMEKMSSPLTSEQMARATPNILTGGEFGRPSKSLRRPDTAHKFEKETNTDGFLLTSCAEAVKAPAVAMNGKVTFRLLYFGWLVSAVILGLAIARGHPPQFYTNLRWICCPFPSFSLMLTRSHARRMSPRSYS